MNINYPFRAGLLTCLLAVGTCLTAQDKAAVILINSIPYNVLLSTDGEVVEIKGEAVGHMKGFIRSADEFDIPSSDRTIDIVSDVAKGASVRNERNMIDFEANYATLADSAVPILDRVVSGYQFGSDEKILISAFKADESEDNSLYTSRIKTIRTYLELKGVPVANVLTEVVVSNALKDKVSLTYIQ